MEGLFAEKVGLKQIVVPTDINVGGITGSRIKLDAGYKLAVLLNMGDSVGATVEFTLKQHNASVGGTTKDLATAKPYFHKAGAATSFTKVEPTVAAALKDVSAIFAGEEGLLVLELDAYELDINNGFAYVSVDSAAAGAAKIVGGVYLVHEAKFKPASELTL